MRSKNPKSHAIWTAQGTGALVKAVMVLTGCADQEPQELGLGSPSPARCGLCEEGVDTKPEWTTSNAHHTIILELWKLPTKNCASKFRGFVDS